MDMLLINGGVSLSGRVAVSGAKNAALPIMAAAICADGPVQLRGVPDLVDVVTLGRLLESLGLQVDRGMDGTLCLETVDDEPVRADYDLVRRMRASVCVLGPLLAKRKRACVSLPGGCNIGDRPIDLHLKGLRALGADLRVERGYVMAEAKRLRGAAIFLGGPFGSTVTGTCNVMAAASLAKGVTTIEAAACEPEVVDLGHFLIAMGAKIEGLGTPFLRIEGVDRLHGTEYSVIPDRIEAATLMIAAAITGGIVELENVRLDHMTAVVEKLRDSAVCIGTVDQAQCGGTPHDQPSSKVPSQTVLVSRRGEIRAADCITLPYPGFPTDVQAQLMSLLCVGEGISIVTEKVFPDRFLHAAELARLGASIRREGPSAIISGVNPLSGANVMASDLRASAALVLAGLAAEGTTTVRRVYHLDRGYDRLEEKLRRLGADVQRVKDDATGRPKLVPAA